MNMRWLVPMLAVSLLMAAAPLAIADDGEADAGQEHRGDRSAKAQEARERAEEMREKAQELREKIKDRIRAHAAKHADKVVLQNDNITIWVHQGERSKPVLAVFTTGEDGNKSGFRMSLDELFEAPRPAPKAAAAANVTNSTDDDDDEEDDDGDGPQFRRVKGHRINLHPAREWWVGIANGTEEVTVTMRHLFNQGNVSLVFHVPVNGSAVKFDVLVEDWRWADANHTLALRMRVHERGATQDGDEATFAGGFVSWADTAHVAYPNGTTATIPVEGFVKNKEGSARVLLLFNGTGGYKSLDYDPTIGVMSGSSRTVPGPAVLAGVGAVAAVALLAGTRRRD